MWYIYFYSIFSVVIKEIKKFFCLFLGIPYIISFCHLVERIAVSR